MADRAQREADYLDAAITERENQPVDRIVDAHVHVGQVRFGDVPVTAERMIEYMNDYGVERSILMPLESPLSSTYYIKTTDMLDVAARYPDRFVPFCSVDPRMHARFGKEKYVRVIRDYIDRGARGFGELKVDLPIDHERMQLLYEICETEGLPILIHIDEFCCTDDVGLPGLERMVDGYDTDFVLHAPGWWNHISADARSTGGYPERPVVRGGRCDELLSEYDNLYADFSMSSGFNALTRDEEYGEEFLRRHHEKLLFATDYLTPGQSLPQFGFFEKFELSREAWENICHRNVERILL